MVNTITTNYEYIRVEDTIQETVSLIQDNLLDFNIHFQDMSWARGELQIIAKELEDTARYFGEQQGLHRTGNLLSNVSAAAWGNTIYFENKARNSRGQFYAGHIEYGHYARDGKTFVEARPFMRPALYAVARASKGELGSILAQILLGTFNRNGQGYQGLSNINFGHKLGSTQDYRNIRGRVVNQMLNSKIGREGFSEQAGFIEKTGFQWSPRRGGRAALNKRRIEDAGWNSQGRNVNRIKAFESQKSNIHSGSRVRVVRNMSSRLKAAVHRYHSMKKRQKSFKTLRRKKWRRRKKRKNQQRQEFEKKENPKGRRGGKNKGGRKSGKEKGKSIQEMITPKTAPKTLTQTQKVKTKSEQGNKKRTKNKVEEKANKLPGPGKKVNGVFVPEGEKQIFVQVAGSEEQYKQYGWGFKRAMYPSVLKEKFSLDANGVYVPLEWGGAKTPSTKSEGQKRRDLKDAYGG